MRASILALVALLLTFGCGDDRRRGPTGDSSVTLDSSAGDSSTGDTGADGGDIPSCDVTPSVDDPCTAGQSCQTPGSPCGSIWTCPDGSWDEEVVCPPPNTCPEEAPEDMSPCTLSNPTSGPLTCTYDRCPGLPLLRAVCDDVAWSVMEEPCPGG